MRSALTALAVFVVAVLAACGGDQGGDDPATTTTVADSACSEIEEVDVPSFGRHLEREFTAADYETNPPAGGDHHPEPLESGSFYTEPGQAPLGEAVHLLEHGAVIGWTNGLEPADQEAVEEAFNDVFQQGYYQLATIENPDLEVPFALSAWGALQTCERVDAEAIASFVEQWYASPKSAESPLACSGTARRLPPC